MAKQSTLDFINMIFDNIKDFKQDYQKKNNLSFAAWADGKIRYANMNYIYGAIDNKVKQLQNKNNIGSTYASSNEKEDLKAVNKGTYSEFAGGFFENEATDEELIEENEFLKEDTKNKYSSAIEEQMAVYCMLKDRAAKRGGFWKSLFTGKIVEYFKERSVVNDIEERLTGKPYKMDIDQINNINDVVTNKNADKYGLQFNGNGEIENKPQQHKVQNKEINYDDLQNQSKLDNSNLISTSKVADISKNDPEIKIN